MIANSNREIVIKSAVNLLKENIISPGDPNNNLNWTERKGPWGKLIKNLLLPPYAHDFITPNKSRFVGQWYWDSMATNTGLLRYGDNKLKNTALCMVNNLFMLYEKLGLIPNAADTVQTSRSQPPFLSTMCRDLSENAPELVNIPEWYKKSFQYCKRELESPWKTHAGEFGFQWFDNIHQTVDKKTPEFVLEYFRPESRSDYRILRSIVYRKLSIDLESRIHQDYREIEPLLLNALNRLTPEQREAICTWLYSRRLLVSSGMDFTYSYGQKAFPQCLEEVLEPDMLSASDRVFSIIQEVSPIDLNCLLYKYYEDLIFFAKKIPELTGDLVDRDQYQKEVQILEKQRNQLKELINSHHYCEDENRFFNFNVKTGKRMYDYPHLTHYIYPLFSGLAEEGTAPHLVSAIEKYLSPYGIRFTIEKTSYQWDFNMWPLQVWVAVQGLKRYGFTEQADQIASGYIKCVEKVFKSHGTFYEKYNPVEGSINTDGRYRAEPDFSWSAGVYLALVTPGVRDDDWWD